MQNDINKWNNLKLNPTTLPEIYNELLFFNTRSIKQNNQSQYAMKNPPPWARDHFGTVGDICKKDESGFISTEELLSANRKRVMRYNPKPKDLFELIKLIPE